MVLLGLLGLHIVLLLAPNITSNAFLLPPEVLSIRVISKVNGLHRPYSSKSPYPSPATGNFTTSNPYVPAEATITNRRKSRLYWTKDENMQLLFHFAELGPKWMEISRHMKGRSPGAIRVHYYAVLDPTLKLKYNPVTATGKTINRPWSNADDTLLLSLIAEHGFKWSSFKAHFAGRSNQDIQKRYTIVLDPSLKKGAWTVKEDTLILDLGASGSWTELVNLTGRSRKAVHNRYRDLKAREDKLAEGVKMRKIQRAWSTEEDARLSELFAVYGRVWKAIAEQMDGRSSQAVRQRYTQQLDPALKGREEWTKDMDDVILEHGASRKWTYIADTYVPGRSAIAVRNRYTTLTQD